MCADTSLLLPGDSRGRGWCRGGRGAGRSGGPAPAGPPTCSAVRSHRRASRQAGRQAMLRGAPPALPPYHTRCWWHKQPQAAAGLLRSQRRWERRGWRMRGRRGRQRRRALPGRWAARTRAEASGERRCNVRRRGLPRCCKAGAPPSQALCTTAGRGGRPAVLAHAMCSEQTWLMPAAHPQPAQPCHVPAAGTGSPHSGGRHCEVQGAGKIVEREPGHGGALPGRLEERRVKGVGAVGGGGARVGDARGDDLGGGGTQARPAHHTPVHLLEKGARQSVGEAGVSRLACICPLARKPLARPGLENAWSSPAPGMWRWRGQGRKCPWRRR